MRRTGRRWMEGGVVDCCLVFLGWGRRGGEKEGGGKGGG